MKQFGKSLAFLAGLLLLLAGASWVFIPKDTTVEAGMRGWPSYCVLAEPKDSIDVVFAGDSLVRNAVLPPIIWKEQGIPTYVCSDLRRLADIESYLRDTLRHQSPKIVMLEADVCFTPMDETARWIYNISRYLPVVGYHDNWKTVGLRQMLRPIHYSTRDPGKGSSTAKIIRGCQPDHYLKPKDWEEKLPEENRKAIVRMKKLCDKKGARLILFHTPNCVEWDFARYNTLTRLAEELDVTYLDMNPEFGAQVIDWRMDTRDQGYHLNWWGAVKTTKYLGEYLAQTGMLEDKRRDPAYGAWDEDYLSFMDEWRNAKTDKETDEEPPFE